MDDKTMQALTALANKLGITAEYLWGVLLKQAPITGLIDLLVMSAWIYAVVMWFRFVQRKTTTPSPTNENRFPRPEWGDQFGVGIAWASVFVLGVIVALVIGNCLSITVSALENPEYWALKQIFK